MEAAPLVTLIAVALAVIVIALFLVTTTYQLHQVSSRLNTILAAVGEVGDKTAVLEPVISDIATDLIGANEAMDGAVRRLQERKGYVDPADPTAQRADHLGQPAPAGGSSVPAGPPPTTFSA
jgi:hypothetical protein